MADWETDEALAERCADAEDRRALEALFHRHLGVTYRFAVRFLSSREDAEEAVSETWLRVSRALRAGSFRGESRFRTWLLGIAKRVCLEGLRQPRLPTLSLTGLQTMDAAQNRHGDWVLFAPVAAPLGRVEEAFAALSDDHRLVLTLCELEGLTDSEAAVILARSVAATKSLRMRARRDLRNLLIEDMKELE